MVEVMMMDDRFDDAGHNEIAAALQQRFELSEDEAHKLIDRAAIAADKAHDLYQFTSRIIKARDTGTQTLLHLMWLTADKPRGGGRP